MLRIAALPGELPYFQRDPASGEWSGACIEMAKDIARTFDANVTYLDSTFGNSVLDLQSNKVDLAFALNATPARALSITFTRPMIIHPFGCLAKQGLAPKTWDDLNRPELTIVFDIGSLHEIAARRYCPKAQLTGYRRGMSAPWRYSRVGRTCLSRRPCWVCRRSAEIRRLDHITC